MTEEEEKEEGRKKMELELVEQQMEKNGKMEDYENSSGSVKGSERYRDSSVSSVQQSEESDMEGRSAGGEIIRIQ